MADKTDSPKSTTPARKPKPVRLNLKPGITATAGQDIESPSSILAPQLKEIAIPKSLQLDLKPEDIVTLVELGSGAGGTVSKIIHVEAKNSVRKQILRELQFLHKCNSPYIVSFYGAFLFEGDISICMEFMNCGSLDQVYKKTGNVPEDVAGKIGYATLAGLAYVYDEHRIIHRGEVKIGDFGVSGQTINSVANTFVGTSGYMSPERIQGESYTSASDVWSLGMTLVELVIGKFPFPPNGQPLSVFELLEYIVHEPVPTLPKGEFSPEFEKFIARSLTKDQTQRPTPSELLKDPYCVMIAAKDVDMTSFVKVLYKE
ncbi:MAP kinase kinase (MEK) [Boothiomyces macroporosus]|uniref:MAP kinase kinase (MEK) n=1 Tax=Boothiomyces macroporosus TaxID=261099 RepID=A0AAD5UCY5_9FUNG|nr:MAP kinase kinase (MEK) [Boothiomyces macroporosus]KAJ3309984.1 MAP kinase kinase (MEK) [Boothiomyces sp. JEL0838]